MNSKRRFHRLAWATFGFVATASPSFAQHHQHGPSHHGVPSHRSGIHVQLVNPFGQRVTQHHDHYRYVLPPAHHHGSYYTFENVHYYTPPAPPVAIGQPQPQIVQRPVAVEFGSMKHYVQLAERLEVAANQLCLDLHYNYQHNPGFPETYREAYQFMQAAKFVHAAEHRGDREAIRRSATSIDDLFHHVQGEVARFTRVERKPIGTLGIQAKIEELEALIHHLLFDLGVKPTHDQEEQAPPPAAEVAPPPAGGIPPVAPQAGPAGSPPAIPPGVLPPPRN